MVNLTDERLGKLQAALVQSQDFEDALDNMARWLDSKDKEVSSPKPISARPDVLRRQVIEHEVRVNINVVWMVAWGSTGNVH